MSYLALFLGNTEGLDMQPVTDDLSVFATFSEDYALGNFHQLQQSDGLRMNLIREILPMPDNVWDVKGIARFKDHYGNLLPRFRQKIELKLTELSFIQNPQEYDFHLNKFRTETQEEVDILIEKLREGKFGKITFGTFCSLGSAAAPIAKAYFTNDWATALYAIPGVLGAVWSAFHGNKARQQQVFDSPFAYAALLNRESRYI
jgi:hypothetical protein